MEVDFGKVSGLQRAYWEGFLVTTHLIARPPAPGRASQARTTSAMTHLAHLLLHNPATARGSPQISPPVS